jgi:hypothetical protein
MWPVGPKLVIDQMAAPVPDIMDGSLYECAIGVCIIMDIIAFLASYKQRNSFNDLNTDLSLV